MNVPFIRPSKGLFCKAEKISSFVAVAGKLYLSPPLCYSTKNALLSLKHYILTFLVKVEMFSTLYRVDPNCLLCNVWRGGFFFLMATS